MQRQGRYFLLIGILSCSLWAGAGFGKDMMATAHRRQRTDNPSRSVTRITLFLCGDVMLGRGIDQALPYPGDPTLHESYVKNARDYVRLAEAVNGPIPAPVDWTYVWGDALAALKKAAPDLRIINLETSITQSNDFWKNKGIHYRMHPANAAALTVAGIDGCCLANNHILDWGDAGLQDTLETLQAVGIQSAGAGQNSSAARRPAVMEIAGKGRVIFLAYGLPSSGIPKSWAAAADKPGINLLESLSRPALGQIQAQVQTVRQAGDVVVVSIHWGVNWGHAIPSEHITFAHRLIDEAGADVIHGHSSHHALAIEIYQHKPILYGCGDFINDYEGIGGYEQFRADLGLMYLVSMEPSTGRLLQLQLLPTRMERFQIHMASSDDSRWLKNVLARESKRFGTQVEMGPEDTLIVSTKKV
jgi:poly-gamma-glutamate capsule biosynthesis protein CapA/YwtB (metallophosphatase superfamily)